MLEDNVRHILTDCGLTVQFSLTSEQPRRYSDARTITISAAFDPSCNPPPAGIAATLLGKINHLSPVDPGVWVRH